MKTIQIIELRGRPAALVAGVDAIVPERLTGPDRARVKAKALYAIEIADGTRPGPYTDELAEQYAETVAALRSSAARRRMRRRSHRRRQHD